MTLLRWLGSVYRATTMHVYHCSIALVSLLLYGDFVVANAAVSTTTTTGSSTAASKRRLFGLLSAQTNVTPSRVVTGLAATATATATATDRGTAPSTRGHPAAPAALAVTAAGIKPSPRHPMKTGTVAKLSSPDDDVAAAPKLLQPWIRFYRSMPKVHVAVPLCAVKLDIAFTLIWAVLFIGMDSVAELLVRALTSAATTPWPRAAIRATAGSITTIGHASVLVVVLPQCLWSSQRYEPNRRLDSHPQWWQDAATAVIQFCSGYMIYDTAIQLLADQWVPGVGLVFTKASILFIVHHVVSFFYMASTRLLQAGHLSAMMLMFLGEATAPIMNLRRIANTAASVAVDGGGIDATSWLVENRPLIEWIYAALYIFFRCVTGPICGLHLTYDLLLTKEGRKNIPIPLSVTWIAICWGIIIGSIPWVKGALVILGLSSESAPPIHNQ